MRSSALPLVGLALIIVGGIAFGVYFFVSESSAPTPRNSTAAAPDDKPKRAPKPAPENRAAPAPETPQPGDATPAKTEPPKDTTPKPIEQPAQPADTGFRVTISGRVLDETGQGLPGIDVTARIVPDAKSNTDRRKEDSPDGASDPLTTTSGADGKYSLEITQELRSKQQTIRVEMGVTTRGWALQNAVTHDGLRAGTSKTVDLKVVPAGSAVGRVVDSSGSPLSHMAISATRLTDGEQRAVAPSMKGPTAITDSAGQYRFDALLVGNWEFTLMRKADGGSAKPVTGTVDAGSETTLDDIVLSEPATVRFRAVDGDGNPLPHEIREAGLSLTFVSPDGSKTTMQAVPGDNGTVDCANVPASATQMLVHHPGLASTETVALSLKGGVENDIGDVRLTLKAAGTDGVPDGSVPGEDGK